MASRLEQIEFTAISNILLKDLFCQTKADAFNIDNRIVRVLDDEPTISLVF